MNTFRNLSPDSRLYFSLLLLLGGRDQSLRLQPRDDIDDALLDGLLCRVDGDLGVLGGLVRRADAGELLDLARARLLVQALGIALLGHLDGDLDVDLDEGDGLIGRPGRLGGVQGAGEIAVRLERRDEGRQGDGRRVGEELGHLYFSRREEAR